ncbi:MAG: DUF493 domain-containing protein [Anaerolineae bacterium]|nr:DUF493 domain-containing protein [Anaerolineae bacterium]
MDEPMESPLVFPCDFPLKIIGKNEDDFETFVVDLVKEYVPYLQPEDITRKESAGGKYISITFNFMAIDRQQVDKIYIAMSAHKERILFAL